MRFTFAVVLAITTNLLIAPARAQDSTVSSPDSGVGREEMAVLEETAVHDAGPRVDQIANDGVIPAGNRTYESTVRARRSIVRDQTQDNLKIDGQRLRNSPRASTLEALSQESAGVYVPGRGAFHGVANGATGGVHIRGLGGSPNSQVLIVEDGVPDYMGLFGHPIPDAYVPSLIEDALVIKGGDSVLYGTNAMGGVVALRNRWRDKEGFEFVNDAAYGSYSTMLETAAVLGRADKLDFVTAFHALNTD
ncbi:MAG: Plug domain-containing protein, partial [Pseudomonadota bacterium]